MTKYFLLILFAFSRFISDSQDYTSIDSLIAYAESIRYADPPAADSLYQIALKESKKINYLVGIGNAYKGIGVAADVNGDLEKSLFNYEKGFEAFIEARDSIGAYKCRFNAGMIYRKLGLYQQAKEIFNDTYIVFETYNFSAGTILCKVNLGICFYDQKNFIKALEIFKESKRLSDEMGHVDYNLYGNMGNCYYQLGEKDSALQYLQTAYSLAKDMNSAVGMASFGFVLAQLYHDRGDLDKAVEIVSGIKVIVVQFNMTSDIIKASRLLSEYYSKTGDFKNAFYNLKQSTHLLDSSNNVAFRMELETKEEFIANQKSKNEIALLKEQEKATELESERKGLINKGLATGAIFLIVIAALLFFQNKKRRQLNNILQDKNDQIEEQHKEIMDSIVYAKRIQYAVLPPDKLVKAHLKNSFILYKPKNIVAGDFYWLEKKDNTVLFAVCDCTGHGVPGAMVSVICNNALNRAVREHGITEPGKLLDKAREIVIREFEKSEEEVKDGMDTALCALHSFPSNNDREAHTLLKYAGAHNPLWIVRGNELIEIKGDNQPVGKFDSGKPFNTHSIELQKGDVIYVFSDGYVDQFGGDKGKKFKARSLREVLLSIQNLSMDDQQKKLEDIFESWRGDLEQVDDVCVIGVRV